MTTATETPAQAIAAAAVDKIGTGKWSEWFDLPDGRRARAMIESDDQSLEDNGDWFGSIHWPERNTRERPAGCNGAARKVTTRGGYCWWQPPADLLNNAAGLEATEKRVRGYYLEEWSFVGVRVEVQAVACACCGNRATKEDALCRCLFPVMN